MKPGETYTSVGGNTLSQTTASDIEAHFAYPSSDDQFFHRTTQYQESENIRHSLHTVTVDKLRTTGGWLTAFTNDPNIPVSLNGAPGYGHYPAFSTLTEIEKGAAKTTRIVLSRPYDAFPSPDGLSQSVCFALVGSGGDGDMHLVIARLSRNPEVAPDTPIGQNELQNATPLAFVAQREDNHNITVFNVSCQQSNPEFPSSRPRVNISHFTKESAELFKAAELPRILAAMPLT